MCICFHSEIIRSLQGYYSVFMWWHFLVLIEVEPARTRNLNIVGFGVVALTDDDRIVGRFLDQRDVLIASCDPLLEGSTAFHARPAAKRSSLKLVWLPLSRNYGRVHFRLVTLFFPFSTLLPLFVCMCERARTCALVHIDEYV